MTEDDRGIVSRVYINVHMNIHIYVYIYIYMYDVRLVGTNKDNPLNPGTQKIFLKFGLKGPSPCVWLPHWA